MLLLVLTYWEIHSIQDSLSVKSMENQLLSLALIFWTRVWYLPLVFSYLLFWQQHPSRYREQGRTMLLLGRLRILWSDSPALTLISAACVYPHAESVLQAPPGWGTPRALLPLFPGVLPEEFPGKTTLNSEAPVTALGCAHRTAVPVPGGSQDHEGCANTAHSSCFNWNERFRKDWRFGGKLHISKVSVIISQTALFFPRLKFTCTSGQTAFKRAEGHTGCLWSQGREKW